MKFITTILIVVACLACLASPGCANKDGTQSSFGAFFYSPGNQAFLKIAKNVAVLEAESFAKSYLNKQGVDSQVTDLAMAGIDSIRGIELTPQAGNLTAVHDTVVANAGNAPIAKPLASSIAITVAKVQDAAPQLSNSTIVDTVANAYMVAAISAAKSNATP